MNRRTVIQSVCGMFTCLFTGLFCKSTKGLETMANRLKIIEDSIISTKDFPDNPFVKDNFTGEIIIKEASKDWEANYTYENGKLSCITWSGPEIFVPVDKGFSDIMVSELDEKTRKEILLGM